MTTTNQQEEKKVALADMREKQVYGDTVIVYRNIRYNGEAIADVLSFDVPKVESFNGQVSQFDGKSIQLHDWKADFETGTINVRGHVYMGFGQYATIDGTFPCKLTPVALKKPGKNWEWSAPNWRNVKTGERKAA